MNAGWIFLCIIAAVIISRLFSKLGQEEEKTERFRGVLPGTGQVFEMTIVKNDDDEQTQKKANEFDENDFLMGAKIAFNAIADAFSVGRKDVLKSLVSKRVYEGFSAEIDRRDKAGEKMEFSLIAINSAKVIARDNLKKPNKVKVELISEQMNVLRGKDGQVLEGDPIMIAKVKDIWTFEKKSGVRSGWQVVATKSEAV